MSEKFSVFVTDAPDLPLPLQQTDYVPVVRADVTYKQAITRPTRNYPPPYTRIVPVSGNTYSATLALGAFRLAPASSIATLTLVLPPTPSDGDLFEISTSLFDIVALTVQGASLDPIDGGGPFTLAANGGVSWQWSLAATVWMPRY